MAIELMDWTMRIMIKDRRYKEGWRPHKTYVYKDKHEGWMHEEIRDLGGLYPAHKYHIEVEPVYVTVKSLMTGEPVKILYTDRGTACDPSMERYWTM